MKYADGNEAHVGDHLLIDGQYHGEVVACIDRDEYSPNRPREQWAYLARGVMVDTDFGGLVHYADGEHEHLVLLSRAAAAG